MANPSTPYGFRQVGVRDGVAPNFGITTVQIDPANTGSIYGGDVAAVISGGYVAKASVTGGGAPIGGIFLPHFSWLSLAAGMRVWNRAWRGQTGDVAGGTIEAKIVNFPDALFQVRSTGASAVAVPATAVGSNANFALGAGPGNNLISTVGLDDSTLGSGASLPFRVHAIVQPPESDPTALYNEVIVSFFNLANL